MEANTICLSLDKYHDLFEYKQNLERKNSIFYYQNNYAYRIVTKDESLKILSEANTSLQNDIIILNKQVTDLPKELIKIKKLSFFQLIRWYFNKK